MHSYFSRLYITPLYRLPTRQAASFITFGIHETLCDQNYASATHYYPRILSPNDCGLKTQVDFMMDLEIEPETFRLVASAF